MKRAYRALLKLYPYDFRSAFAAEMMAALETNGNRRAPELASLIAGAAAEWLAKLTTDQYVRGRVLPDIRRMRPAGMPRELWFARAACSPDTLR